MQSATHLFPWTYTCSSMLSGPVDAQPPKLRTGSCHPAAYIKMGASCVRSSLGQDRRAAVQLSDQLRSPLC